jgi:hypothetical protein
MKKTLLRITIVLSLLASASVTHAGVFTDELSRCLVRETSAKDKADLVRWIFAVASLHQDVASIASVSKVDRTAADRAVGALFQRLLTDSCRKQTIEANKYESDIAIKQSFKVLGEVAMQELMSAPAVNAGVSNFMKYVDEAKLREVFPEKSK